MRFTLKSKRGESREHFDARLRDAEERQLVTALVSAARKQGLDSVDSFKLNLDGGANSLGVDVVRVRQLANEELLG